jgi:small GTP-binding protein
VLESALEFVEDDLPKTQMEEIQRRLESVSASIRRIAETYKAGHLLREGISVAIIGWPNVGKSSLFNALVGSDRAIVTDIAGTTRDQIHERFSVDGIPVSLIDTAGLRETTDSVESIGVERSRRTMADADIVMVMLDVSEPAAEEDGLILQSSARAEHIIVVNKIDKVDTTQVSEAEWVRLRSGLAEEALTWQHQFEDLVNVGEMELTGVLASAAHLAYHLGAIRQILPNTRGPAEST